jgi:acyl dehydratase
MVTLSMQAGAGHAHTGKVSSQAHPAAAPPTPPLPVHVEVAGLRELAGKDLGTGPWHEIRQQDVDGYADLTGDRQWIHVDPGRAAAGPFGATVAHGFFTLGRFTGLLREILVVTGVRTVLNYGVNRVRFPAPARVGARLRMGLRIDQVEELADSVQVLYRATFEVEGQAKPVCVAEVLFRHYPSGSGGG